MTTSPRIGFTDLEQGETIPEVVTNESLRMLEQMGNHAIVKDRATTPPGSPVDGDTYLIIATATGAWTGKENQLALRIGTSWKYVTPIEGTTAYVQDENVRYRYDGSAWGIEPNNVATPTPDLDDLNDVNTGTPADGEVLTWDDGASEWVSAPAPGSGGGSGGTVPNGGDTGQVLVKASGVDQDVEWGYPGLRGAMVEKSADQTGANYSGGAAIAWDGEIYDAGGWHDNVTNNSRLTVPADVSYVRVHCSVRMANVTTNSLMSLTIQKNGSTTFDGAAQTAALAAGANPGMIVSTGVIPVVATDYFEAFLVNADTSIDITAARSNFSIEAVG